MSCDGVVRVKQVISDMSNRRCGRTGRIDEVFKRAKKFQNFSALINTAPGRALRFPGVRKSQRCGKTVTHSRTQRVALRSEDSAISSVTNKSFRIPIAHPILSLRSFSRISGGWLDRGG